MNWPGRLVTKSFITCHIYRTRLSMLILSINLASLSIALRSTCTMILNLTFIHDPPRQERIQERVD